MFAAIVTPFMEVTFVEERPNGIGWMQDAVGGRFDVIATAHADVWVNDEMLFSGFPQNLIGSAIAGQPVFGNVLVTGGVDDEGETTPILPRLAKLLKRDCVEA